VDQRGHDQTDGAEQFGEAERFEQRGGKIVDPAAESLRELVAGLDELDGAGRGEDKGQHDLQYPEQGIHRGPFLWWCCVGAELVMH
jgi:hypothetical protein